MGGDKSIWRLYMLVSEQDSLNVVTHTAFIFNNASDFFVMMYRAVVEDNHTPLHRERIEHGYLSIH